MRIAAVCQRSTLGALLCLMSLVMLAGCNKIENRPKMKIGYMNCNNEEETTGRFTPMTRYLSEKTGVVFEFVPVTRFAKWPSGLICHRIKNIEYSDLASHFI